MKYHLFILTYTDFKEEFQARVSIKFLEIIKRNPTRLKFFDDHLGKLRLDFVFVCCETFFFVLTIDGQRLQRRRSTIAKKSFARERRKEGGERKKKKNRRKTDTKRKRN